MPEVVDGIDANGRVCVRGDHDGCDGGESESAGVDVNGYECGGGGCADGHDYEEGGGAW